LGNEPPRVCQRPEPVRGYGHGQGKQVLARGQGEIG
jgi:hypothetical protein